MILSQAGNGAKCQFEKACSTCLLFLFCKAQKIEIGVQGHMEGGRENVRGCVLEGEKTLLRLRVHTLPRSESEEG